MYNVINELQEMLHVCFLDGEGDGEFAQELRSAINALEAIKLYDAAAEKFIAKVESGRARSTETYNDLKQALAKSKGVV